MKPIKHKEAKLLPLLFTAASGICLGLLLGIFYLLSLPPEKLSSAPKPDTERVPGRYTATFVEGRRGVETPNLRTGVSRIERRTIGPVSFSEDEVNYFFSQFKGDKDEKSKPTGPSQQGQDEQEKPESSLEQFNVHLDGDQMVVSFKLIIDPKGDRFEMLVQGNVGFENTDTGPQLRVNSLKVNSLPVPTLGGAVTSMIESKIAQAQLPDDLVKMWKNVRKIELESSKLIVDVGMRKA